MNTKTFVLIAAVAFQCFVQHNEAANISKQRIGVEAPEDLLRELRELVFRSVEDGVNTLTSTLEDSKSKVSGIRDDAKAQLEKEKEELLKELDELKTKAEAAKASDCVEGDEGQIDHFFRGGIVDADNCANYFLNTVDDGLTNGVSQLQKLKELEPELSKELEGCGDSADCKDKVAGKISKAIEDVPEKVKSIIDKTSEVIGVGSLNKCVSEQVLKFHDGVKYILKVAQECIDKKSQ